MLVGGNKKAALNFLGPARSQLEILKNQMSFQNLSQGVRKIWLNEDVYVECRKCFNYQECRVFVKEVIEQEIQESTLIIVVSNQAGDKAFAWDLINDQVIMTEKETEETEEVIPFADLEEFLLNEDYTPLVLLEPSGTWQKTSVDQYGNLPESFNDTPWIFNVTSSTNDGLILPVNPDQTDWNFELFRESNRENNPWTGSTFGFYFLIYPNAFYAGDGNWEDGDSVVLQTYRAGDSVSLLAVNSSGSFDISKVVIDKLGSIDQVWTLTIIRDFSHLNHVVNITGNTVGILDDSVGGIVNAGIYSENPNTYGLDYISPEPYTIETDYIELSEEGYRPLASYVYSVEGAYKGEYDSNSIWLDYFELATGQSWPIGINEGVSREFYFYSPFLGPDYTDYYPGINRMKATTTELYDSFHDGDWSEPALYDDPSSGIVAIDWYAHNRVNIWTTIGLAKSYEAIDEEDITKQNAWVAVDAYAICKYVGDCENSFEINLNLAYWLLDPLTGNEKSLFDLVNAERVSQGENALKYNHVLQIAAKRMADDAAENGFQLGTGDPIDSHQGSDGSWPDDRVQDAGYFKYANELYFVVGENSGYLSLNGVMLDMLNAWLNSPGHRANLLYTEYTETGLAISQSDEYYYIVQVFGAQRNGNRKGWAGFGAFDTTKIVDYINNNFDFYDILEKDNFLTFHTAQKIITTTASGGE